MSTDQGTVHVEIEERAGWHIARVAMDNPGKLNAGSPGLIQNLQAAFEELAHDDRLRCAVLTGAGDRAFMAGADIGWLSVMTPDTGRGFITALHLAAQSVRALPVPVIGRLRGYCLGAGLELAAACDFRVADHGFVMGMPEVKVGLPSVIEAALFPQLIGWGRTRELLMTGANYDAEAALAMGFVEKLVAPEALDDAVEDWIGHIMANGPRAVRSQKALIGKWERLGLDAAIEAGIEHFAEAYESDEPQRMLAPFLKKER